MPVLSTMSAPVVSSQARHQYLLGAEGANLLLLALWASLLLS